MKKSILQIFNLISFVCLFITYGISQQYNFQLYSDKNGYSAPETLEIFSDSRGFLWLASVNGITCYDGSKFKNYDKTIGLLDNTIGGLIEDENKNILVSTKRGICSFDGEKFRKIPVRFKDKKDHKLYYFSSFYRTKNNEVYALSYNGLFRLDKKKNCFIQDEFFTFSSPQMAEDLDGKLFVATVKGLYEGKNGKWKYSKLNKQIKNTNLSAIEIDKKGNKWIGSTTTILKVNPKNQILDFKIEPNRIFDLKVTSDNTVIAGGLMAKVYVFKDEKIEVLDLQEYISTSEILHVEEDYQGNIWLAASAYLVKMTESPVNKSKHFEKITGPFASMTLGNSDQLYIGTLNGIYEKTIDKLTNYKPSNDPNDLFISALTYHKNKLYLGTFSGKVYVFENKKFKLLLDNKGTSDPVYKILIVNDSEFWICQATKLSRLKKGKVSTYTISHQYTQSALLDSKGKLWVANFNKLVIFENEKFKEVAGSEKYYGFVTITEDENGIIWVGTYGNGILKFKNKQIEQITKKQGLTNDFICSSLYDASTKTMWVGTMYGITQLKLNKKSGIVSVNKYLNSPNIDNYGCIQNGIVKLKNGHVLISVGDQIYEYNGQENNLKNPRMKLDFSGFKVNNQLIKKDNRFKINKWNSLPVNPIFEHFENNLEFNFIAVNYHENSSVSYSWKLEGFDNKWSNFSDRKFMNYTNLPAGIYTFKVKAVDEAYKNVSVIQFRFEILTPFYKSFWFIFLVILLIGTTVYFVFTSRVKKIKRETSEKIMNFQKLAESELKALRAQMNPHFMFNTINSIQELVLGNDDRTARIYFADFAKMMRMILENSTQKLITLEKEIDFLNLYLSFEKVRFKDKFELRLIVDERLETSLLKLPSMLIQPFIENAINHGLLHKESNGKLEVKFEQIDFENEVFLKCTIEDNGIGREAAMKLNKWRKKQHHSISTTVNSERIELLNTIMENKKFYLLITDLKEGETATGTKVELLISI
jgi:ligand-binding sensor domain-containing protein